MTLLRVLAFEINAVWHCNLACVACTHASPVAPVGLADPDAVEHDLSRLSKVVNARELRILGGEPLLHPRLPELLRAVRWSGLTATVRLSTNGTRLHATDFEWLQYVDEVHVSRYPAANVRQEGLDELARRCRQAGITLILKEFHSFRDIQPAHELTPEETQAVYDTCQQAHAWSCHTVHDGHVYLCPVTADPGFVDGQACPIEPVGTLAGRLAAFLSRPSPLRACSRCLGTVGSLIPHQQANAKNWLTLTRSGSIDHRQIELVHLDPLADNGCSSHEVLVSGARESHWVGLRA